jgi:hypothetical protein
MISLLHSPTAPESIAIRFLHHELSNSLPYTKNFLHHIVLKVPGACPKVILTVRFASHSMSDPHRTTLPGGLSKPTSGASPQCKIASAQVRPHAIP